MQNINHLKPIFTYKLLQLLFLLIPNWIAVFAVHAQQTIKATTTSSTAMSPTPPAPPRVWQIVIDPGHGGQDIGAKKNNIKESNIALEVSLQVEKILQKMNENPKQKVKFSVTLTRTTDQTLTLTERAHLARSSLADLFLSIHANASTDTRARGTEFWFQNQLPPDEESLFMASRENQNFQQSVGDSNSQQARTDESLSRQTDITSILEDLARQHQIHSSYDLAQHLQKAWVRSTPSSTYSYKRTHLRQAPFYLVSEIPSPSILIELGYITHKEEAQAMQQPEYQKQMAQRIAEGILSYTIDNSELSRHD